MTRVLIIEDDPDVRELTVLQLRDSNYEVESACDGREGLAMIEATAYDVILSDVYMGKLDGFRLLSILRKKGIAQKVIIGFVSAGVTKADWNKLRGKDLDFILTKPFSRKDLLKKIETSLKLGKKECF